MKFKKTIIFLGSLALFTLASCSNNNATPKVMDFNVTNNTENIQSSNSIDFSVKFKNLSNYDVISYNVKKIDNSGEEFENIFADSKNTNSDSYRYFTYSPFIYQKGDTYELTKVNFEEKKTDKPLSIDVSGFKVTMDEENIVQNYYFDLNKTENIAFEDKITCQFSSNDNIIPRYIIAELVNENDSSVKFEYNEYVDQTTLKTDFTMPKLEEVFNQNDKFSTKNTSWILNIKSIKLSNNSIINVNQAKKLKFINEGLNASLTVSLNTLNEDKTINGEKYYSYNDATFKVGEATIYINNTLNISDAKEIETIIMNNNKVLKRQNNDFTITFNKVNNEIVFHIQNYEFKTFEFVGFTYKKISSVASEKVLFEERLNILDCVSDYNNIPHYYTINSFDDISIAKITAPDSIYTSIDEFLNDKNIKEFILASNISLTQTQLENSIFNGEYNLLPEQIFEGNGKKITIQNYQKKPLFNINSGTIKNLIIETSKENNEHAIIANENNGYIQNIQINSSFTKSSTNKEISVIVNNNKKIIKNIEINNNYKNEDDDVLNVYLVLNNTGKISNVINKFSSYTFDTNSKNIMLNLNPKDNSTGEASNIVLYGDTDITKTNSIDLFTRSIAFNSNEQIVTENIKKYLVEIKKELEQGILNAESGNSTEGITWIEDGKYSTITLLNQADALNAFQKAYDKFNSYYDYPLINVEISKQVWKSLDFEESNENNVDVFWYINNSGLITLKFSQKA